MNDTVFMSAEKWENLRSLRRFSANFRDALSRIATELLAKRLMFVVLGGHAWTQNGPPSARYNIAGCPFGRNLAGKKRWVREMKKLSKKYPELIATIKSSESSPNK